MVYGCRLVNNGLDKVLPDVNRYTSYRTTLLGHKACRQYSVACSWPFNN